MSKRLYASALLAWGLFACWLLSACVHPSPRPPVPCEVTNSCPQPPQPPVITMPRLVPTGGFFRLENGERHTVIEITDFQLLDLFLRGVDLTPILEDRCGFTQLRVFGMARNLFDLDPAAHPDYYDKLPLFAQALASHHCHFRIGFTVFADARLVMPDLEAQLEHWRRVQSAFALSNNVLLELVNENDQGPNTLDTDRFEAPTNGLCASHGSNGSEALPVRPWWCWEAGPHTNLAFQFFRKVGHNAMELTAGDPEGFIAPSRVPAFANENKRGPDQFNNPTQAYDAAAGAALLAAGSTFHCDGCRWSRVMTDQERELARAWVAGALSVPLACQDGPYKHRQDLEQPNAGETGERVYQRGDDPACIVYIHGW